MESKYIIEYNHHSKKDFEEDNMYKQELKEKLERCKNIDLY